MPVPLRWKQPAPNPFVERPGKHAVGGWDHKRTPVPPNRCVLVGASPVPLGSADGTMSDVNACWGIPPERPFELRLPSRPNTGEGFRGSWLNRSEYGRRSFDKIPVY